LTLLVRLYRCTLSPAKIFLFGPLGNCRFEPSCSQYALDAVKTHGAASGSWLAVKRICRCNPYGGCGHDPVPPKDFHKDQSGQAGNLSAQKFASAHSK
jgi:putative membrane protein insertion efficiency factor